MIVLERAIRIQDCHGFGVVLFHPRAINSGFQPNTLQVFQLQRAIGKDRSHPIRSYPSGVEFTLKRLMAVVIKKHQSSFLDPVILRQFLVERLFSLQLNSLRLLQCSLPGLLQVHDGVEPWQFVLCPDCFLSRRYPECFHSQFNFTDRSLPVHKEVWCIYNCALRFCVVCMDRGIQLQIPIRLMG